MNKIVINGKPFNVSGKNINIMNDTVYVDGKPVESGLSGIVQIAFEGDLAKLISNASVTVNGDIHGNVAAGGSIKCEDIGGSADAGGSIKCGNVSGNADAGGSIKISR